MEIVKTELNNKYLIKDVTNIVLEYCGDECVCCDNFSRGRERRYPRWNDNFCSEKCYKYWYFIEKKADFYMKIYRLAIKEAHISKMQDLENKKRIFREYDGTPILDIEHYRKYKSRYLS